LGTRILQERALKRDAVTKFPDLSLLLLLLAVLNMRVMCKGINPLARYSSPPVTRHRRTYTLLRRPWLLAVSGKVTQFATPVTRHTVTQRMKCAPHRGRISGIISR
jgi:hypothetical protein